jgi:hypothetical protein
VGPSIFILERMDNAEGIWRVVAALSRDTLSYTDNVLPPPPGGSTVYTYKLTTRNRWGSAVAVSQPEVTIYNQPPPDAPVSGGPVGCLESPTANFKTPFSWSAIPNASWYQLTITQIPGGQVLNRVGPETTVTPGNLTLKRDVTYQWEAAAGNNQGYGPSSTSYFRGCEVTDLKVSRPIGCIDTLRPTINWTPMSDSASQALVVTHVADGAKVVNTQLNHLASGYAIPFDLVAGDEYRINVSASPNGASSRPVYFTPMCADGALAGTAAPTWPWGGDLSLPFSWQEATQATEYLFQIERQDGTPELDQIYSAAQICGGGQCAVMPDLSGVTTIPGGHYWRVQARNSSGPGPWSLRRFFNVP